MDPNKGHGENIRTYNRTENRTAEFLDDRERPPPSDLILKTCDRTAFIFEFDAQRSISSLVSPAALERAIIKRNVRPRIDSKPAPHKVAKSPDPYGVSD